PQQIGGTGPAPDHHVQERDRGQQRQLTDPLHHRARASSCSSWSFSSLSSSGSSSGTVPCAEWSGHSPKTSRVWSTSEKPCSCAIAVIELSSFGARNSTVRPHLRHTR